MELKINIPHNVFFLPPIGHPPPFHPSVTFPPSHPPFLPPPSTCRRAGHPPWKTPQWRRHHPKPEARDRRRSKSWSASSTATCWSTRCRGCWETRRTASWSWTTVAKCRRSELQRLKRPLPGSSRQKAVTAGVNAEIPECLHTAALKLTLARLEQTHFC